MREEILNIKSKNALPNCIDFPALYLVQTPLNLLSIGSMLAWLQPYQKFDHDRPDLVKTFVEFKEIALLLGFLPRQLQGDITESVTKVMLSVFQAGC